jgi:beta-lactam-binding protein with PASTA domain/tRNA A-37 threonylcarbamoyl transferase component Bud32
LSAEAKTYGGRYAILESIGSGGMAEVYRARDELLGREVAVKVLSERLSRDRSFVERFRREAQAAAGLSHPNIVSLYDYGSDEGAYYIVMEHIDGRALADVIRDEGPLLPERAAEIAADVAKALERAHGAGLVHRDIKPSNIMLTSFGQTKVTDFGIVRALGGDGESTMTQTGMVIGTASYLSPEQAQGNPVDARSDVYALGCVLYEMLTGQTPFTGDTPLSIAYKQVREDPKQPSTVNPDVPSGMDAITMKALAKNPDNRYSSAAEMREDLQRFLSGHAVQATPLMADQTMVAPAGEGTRVMERADEEEYEPPEGRRRAAFYVVVALLILALFGLLAWLLADSLFGGPTVRVPNVVGRDVDRARDILEEAGFEVDTQPRNSPKPEDEVLEQDPEAGEGAEEGSTVLLSISAGRRQTTVPDVEGLTLDEATEELEDARLRVGETSREASETVPENEVISQDPPADEEVDRGSEVDLVVSSGPETVTVPDVINQREDSAIAEITAAGLNEEVARAPSDEVEEGLVISQDPGPGEEAQSGDTVRILVSEGSEERAMPDVTGQNGDDAESVLESDYGLDVEQVEESEEVCTEPPGFVCRQDPEPGTPVSEGDDATLYVQSGEAQVPLVAFALSLLRFL